MARSSRARVVMLLLLLDVASYRSFGVAAELRERLASFTGVEKKLSTASQDSNAAMQCFPWSKHSSIARDKFEFIDPAGNGRKTAKKGERFTSTNCSSTMVKYFVSITSHVSGVYSAHATCAQACGSLISSSSYWNLSQRARVCRIQLAMCKLDVQLFRCFLCTVVKVVTHTA